MAGVQIRAVTGEAQCTGSDCILSRRLYGWILITLILLEWKLSIYPSIYESLFVYAVVSRQQTTLLGFGKD